MTAELVGAARLLIELHSAYVQMCAAAGEEPSSEIHEQMVMFSENFNDDASSLTINPCGKRFGIFSKD